LGHLLSGSDVSVERKYKTSITFAPTAKHTLIGNQYMVVSDRSDGTIRRIFPIHFGVQISKEERDIRLIDRDFWYDSKEIEGVLYWALLGLRRLKEKNWEWTQVDASEQIKRDIKEESQPEIGFFKQCLESSENNKNKIGCKQLHELYVGWMGKSKAQLKQITLIKAFLEFFPDSTQSKNSVSGKTWEGRQRSLDKIKIIVPATPEAYSGKHSDAIYALNDAYRTSQNEITKLKETIKAISNKTNNQSKELREQSESIVYLNDHLTYLWKKLEDPKLELSLNTKDVPHNT
jgi:phage/plasmid-associated DNA primase